MDNQVKVRGFRIELGEIEVALSKHPGVKQNIVTVREDGPGQKRLVAYIVPNLSPAPTGSELRAHLSATLPDYMIPTAFVSLASLPLTPNGKVDRRALPKPDQAGSISGRQLIPPRSPQEQTLV